MEKVEVSNTMRKIFAFDNKLGYKFGTFMWSGFWLVQILDWQLMIQLGLPEII